MSISKDNKTKVDIIKLISLFQTGNALSGLNMKNKATNKLTINGGIGLAYQKSTNSLGGSFFANPRNLGEATRFLQGNCLGQFIHTHAG